MTSGRGVNAVVVVLIGTVLAAGANTLAGVEPGTAELARLESVWNEAHVHGGTEALDHLWAEDLVVIVPRMAPMTKADALGALRSGRFRFERYATSETSVRLFGEVAVVTGRLQRTRRLNERVLDDDWRFTKVYARRGGRWQVVLFHASEAGP
jgi:hypothetical protein